MPSEKNAVSELEKKAENPSSITKRTISTNKTKSIYPS